MQLFEQGGVLMWPLLVLSIATAAVIFDRLIAFSTFPLYDEAMERRILEAAKGIGTDETKADARTHAPALNALLDALFAPLAAPEKERVAAIAIGDVVNGLDRRVAFLGLSARISPLLGLLGTVFGMIQTFSRLATTAGVVDMTPLADGIWQALLTTAAGLIIAVPAVVAHQVFLRWEDRTSFRLSRLVRLVTTGAVVQPVALP